MAFDTKFNLRDSKFEQAPDDFLTLSGTTNFSTADGGDLLIDGVSIKTLTGSTSGGTSQVENGLYNDGGIVKLGGNLSQDTIIELSGQSLSLGGELGLSVNFDNSNNELIIQNNASILAPTPIFDEFPSLAMGVYEDSGEIKVDVANSTNDWYIVAFTCDANTIIGDDPEGLSYDGSVISYISGDGTFTYYGSTLPSGMLTLMYVYNQLNPRSGSFIFVDDDTANSSTQGSPFLFSMGIADNFVGENIKNFVSDNYLGFSLESEEIFAKMKFYSDGSIGVESSNGAGIKLESGYGNSTLEDNSYIPKSWAKERFDILSGTTPTLANGLTYTETGVYTWGGELTGHTEIIGSNNHGVRFRNIDHFGLNIQNVSLSIDNNPGFGDGIPVTMTSQPDGKILIGGSFQSYSGITGSSYTRLVRINSDRSVDDTFQIEGSGFGLSMHATYVNTVTVLSNGQILAAGNFTDYNGNGCHGIVKLNSDGSEDTSFTANAGVGLSPSSNSIAQCLVEQPDGKILIGGVQLTTYNGESLGVGRHNLFRINADGTLDETFSAYGFSGNAPNGVYVVLLESDGKIVVSGGFSTYSGITCNGYIKLNSDGTPDYTFTLSGLTNNLGNPVYGRISKISNDRYLLNGGFNFVGSQPRNGLAIINSDGTLDETFNPSGLTDQEIVFNVRTSMELPNGQIILGGGYPALSGTSSNGITRFNPSGSIDTTFNQGGTGFQMTDDGFGNWQYPLELLLVNSEIFMIGEFLTYNGNVAYYFTKINTGGTLLVNDNPAFVVANTTIEYGENRHFLYTNRSLVDKEYVDLKVAELVGDQNVYRGGFTGTTIGDSPDSTSFISVLSGTTVSIELTATGSDGTDRVLIRMQGLFYNASGTTQQVGATVPIFTPIKSAGASAWDVEFSVSGDQVRLLVNGDVGQTIKWHYVYEVQSLIN